MAERQGDGGNGWRGRRPADLGMKLGDFLFEELTRYGLVVVPAKPTTAMLKAGVAAAEKEGARVSDPVADAIYGAMVAAAE